MMVTRKVQDDGVQANVDCIQGLLSELEPLVTRSEAGEVVMAVLSYNRFPRSPMLFLISGAGRFLDDAEIMAVLQLWSCH